MSDINSITSFVSQRIHIILEYFALGSEGVYRTLTAQRLTEEILNGKLYLLCNESEKILIKLFSASGALMFLSLGIFPKAICFDPSVHNVAKWSDTL